MENASKALIIAGSILVAIMIVAMGVTIFNKARGSADTTSLDSAEITMFNQKFERFAGDSQSGSNVKSLISFAISNASTNKDEPSKLPYVINNDKHSHDAKPTDGSSTYTSMLGKIRGDIKATASYNVTITYNDASGFIKEIIIEKN